MKILAIDDNRDNLTTLKAILHDALPDADVLTALNGPEGIDFALAEDPDVILLDIVMPGMDGFEVCRKLKQDDAVKHIPVVFLTALKTDRKSRVKALDIGAEAFLTKPIDEVELIAQIRAMKKIKEAHVFEQGEKDRLAALVLSRTQQLAKQLKERMEAEKALRESEEAIRALMDATTDAAFMVDLTGKILTANREMASRLGCSIAEMIGASIWDILPGEVIDERKAAMETVVRTGKMVRFEDQRGDRSIHNSLHPVFDAAGKVVKVAVFGRDTTEQREAEAALREREAWLRAASESSLDSFFIFRAERNDAGEVIDLVFVYVNRTAEEMLQMPRETLLGKRMCEVLPINREAGFFEKYKRVLETGIPLTEEFFLANTHVPAAWYYHEVLPLPDGIAISHRDITDRKCTEERLRSSQAMLARTERIAHIGSWEWEIAADVVTWSKELFRIHHLDPEKGAPNWAQHHTLYHPEDFERLRHAAERAVSDGTPYELELRAVRRDGKTRICLARGFTEMGPDGKAVRLFGSFQDITDRKRAEEEREKLQAQLLQAQKMESVGRLAGGVAHDFNNMLQSILGYADLALMKMDKEHPVYTDIEEIRNTAKRSGNIIRQLLAFARKQVITPVVLDLNDQVGGMLKMLRRLIGEDINLAWLPGADVWEVRMDPSQIDQILVNLVVNARDAIEDVGQVSIETANVALDEAYCAEHPGSVPGPYVRLSVSDTGCGMDTETLHNIFEPFFTTKEVGKGTGLGLATVYGIVKQNKGYIEVYSEPGKGASFHIYLPWHEVEAKEDETAAAVSAGPARGAETVLLVEDGLSVLESSRRMLTALGYTVLAAATPEEAIRHSEAHSGDIHLLLTDVVMPGMNGRDLADRIRQSRLGVRCLYMSGYTVDIIARQGVLEKEVQFIQKPFSLDQLARKVREAMGSEK